MSHYIRNSLYFELVSSLQMGESVVVSGPRLSGRSSLLRRLALEADGQVRPALAVNGIGRETGALESIRFALAERDYTLGPTRASVLVTLRRHLEGSEGPVVIDDAQRMDTESLIALEQVASRVGRPLAISTSTMDARLRRDGVTLFPDALQLSLLPVGMEDATALVADALEGAPENGTTAQILTKSGGIPGVIVALARDGRRTGTLYEENGVWTSLRQNWTFGGKRTVLSLIDDLESREIDELTRLALLGRVDGDVAEKIMDADALAVLEQQGFLFREAYDDDLSRVRVSVYPELLAEHLQNQTGLFQRRRLLSQLSVAFPQASPETGTVERFEGGAGVSEEVLGTTADAYLAATIQQNIRAQLVVRVEQWQNHRSLRDAVELLDLLVARGASKEEIRKVIAEAHELVPRNDVERAWFAVWEGRWLGWLAGDPEGALAMLADMRDEVDADARRMLDAASHHIASMTGLSSERDDTWPAHWAFDHPSLLRPFELVSRGRFAEALESLPVGPFPSQTTANLAAYGTAFSMLMLGDVQESITFSRGALGDALVRRDPIGIVLMTNVYAVACVYKGNFHEASRALAEGLAVGYVGFPLVSAQVSNLSLLSILQARQNHRQSAITTYRQAASFGIRYGYLPLAIPELAAAYMDYFDEKPGANDRVWRACEELLDRGYEIAALAAWLFGGPWTAEQNARMSEAASHQKGTLFPPVIRFHVALTADDPALLEASYHEFVELDRGFFAATAALRRARLAGEDRQEYDDWVAAADVAAASLGISTFEVTRFFTRLTRLSEREREIFDLLAVGETNQGIADRLFLSVRTVENHVIRILKKLELRSRKEISDLWSRRAR